MFKPALILGTLMIAGCAATPSASNATMADASAEEDQVCKYRSVTGTRFKEKTCMTMAQWEAQEAAEEAAAKETKGSIDRSNSSTPPNSPG